MNPLDATNLSALMERERGCSDIGVGLIDGPIVQDHPDLTQESIREIPGILGAHCTHPAGFACLHGTFVAGILNARRDSGAPGICPDCTLLLRPIFGEAASRAEQMPSATSEELAAAITDCIAAGAHILNISAALLQSSAHGERTLQEVLDKAARREILVVAAAGNQGTMTSSLITRHSWVIPVAACDLQGRPLRLSNLGSSVGRRGVSAPGENITSLGTDGETITSGGTSAAAPFVTGALALLWSAFPAATATQIKSALTQSPMLRRPSIIPPLLNAWAAYQFLEAALRRK